MEVFVEGRKGKVSLSKNDFVTKGGEASVYIRDNTVFKIYHDPKRMIPVAKISELNLLNDSRIVKPGKIIFDAKHQAVDYEIIEVNGLFTEITGVSGKTNALDYILFLPILFFT